MVRDELSVLAAFLAVAEERSFTKAAKRLEVSTSALSHAISRASSSTTRAGGSSRPRSRLIETLRL